MENKLKVSLEDAILIHKHTRCSIDCTISKSEFRVFKDQLPETLVEKVHNCALSLGYKLKWVTTTINAYEMPRFNKNLI
jgi:hypothetical protein